MLKNIFNYILILTSLLTLVTSCSKDDGNENSNYPITINIGDESISWNKDDLNVLTNTTYMYTRASANNTKAQIDIVFSSDELNSNWLDEINNTEFEVTTNNFPNFLTFQLKEVVGDLSIGFYESQSGTIKVSKVENQKIYLTLNVDLKNTSTNETISIIGKIDGATYTTQE